MTKRDLARDAVIRWLMEHPEFRHVPIARIRALHGPHGPWAARAVAKLIKRASGPPLL